MFKDRRYALLAGLIMMFDNFHFAQTRMGTVDSFLVLFEMLSALFMFKYLLLGKEDTLKQKRKYLFWSGLFFGLSVCVKWTGLYAGLGLCILFFGKMILDTVREKKFNKEYIKIMLSCVYFFVIIPCAIYIFSYLLFPNVEPGGNVSSIGAIFTQIGDMYEYHSTLEATHDFTSPWYTWPVMKRPVWLYVSYLGNGIKGTIAGIGNPAVWWIGAVTSIVVLIKALKSRKMEDVFILVMILATWLPYVFIGRIMFLYHFFPVLPFIMLSIVSVMKDLTKNPKYNSIIVGYMVIVIVLFFVFYPVTSGIPVSEKYINGLRWLKSWYF